MSHQELIDDIADLAKKHKVLWSYFPDSRRVQGHKGFPDIILCGSHHLMVREVKGYYDKLRPEQTVWRYQLIAAGVDVDTWRPDDLKSGRIEQEIRELNAISL